MHTVSGGDIQPAAGGGAVGQVVADKLLPVTASIDRFDRAAAVSAVSYIRIRRADSQEAGISEPAEPLEEPAPAEIPAEDRSPADHQLPAPVTPAIDSLEYPALALWTALHHHGI